MLATKKQVLRDDELQLNYPARRVANGLFRKLVLFRCGSGIATGGDGVATHRVAEWFHVVVWKIQEDNRSRLSAGTDSCELRED